jgi:hypothetical protein
VFVFRLVSGAGYFLNLLFIFRLSSMNQHVLFCSYRGYIVSPFGQDGFALLSADVILKSIKSTSTKPRTFQSSLGAVTSKPAGSGRAAL